LDGVWHMLMPSVVKLQVPELRKALTERGLASEGLRKVLVERLQSALKNEEAGKVKELKDGKEPAVSEPTADGAPNMSAFVRIRLDRNLQQVMHIFRRRST